MSSLSETDKAKIDQMIEEKYIGPTTASELTTTEDVNRTYKLFKQKQLKQAQPKQSGGMVGAADMSAKKTSAPKKKKMPQYYMGGGMIKKNKPYAYGGRVAKYKE